MTSKKALLLVDLQNDFCPNGALAVKEGDQVIPIANELKSHFEHVIASKDWHPSDHTSFVDNHPGHKLFELISLNGIPQVLWPAHCVQHSKGSEFHPTLQQSGIEKIIYKGTDKNIDSYSVFFDNAHLKDTELNNYLHSLGVEEIYIMGLATDYCVKYTALDAVKLGYKVYVIEDGCRGVEREEGDAAKAISEMRDVGVEIINSADV